MATTPSTNTITTVEKVTVTAALNSGAAQLGDLDRTVSTHSGEAQALCDEFHVAPKVDASLDDDSPAPSVTDGTSSEEEACSVEDGCNSEAEFDPPDLPESAPVPRIAIFQEREHGEETIADALPGSFEEDELVCQIICEINERGLQPRGGSTKQVATTSNNSDPMRPKK